MPHMPTIMRAIMLTTTPTSMHQNNKPTISMPTIMPTIMPTSVPTIMFCYSMPDIMPATTLRLCVMIHKGLL